MGRQGPQRQDRAGRNARLGENQVQASLRRQGVTAHQDQEAPHALGQEDQAQRHRDLHAPAGHHDEGGVPLAAGVRHRGPRQCQPQRGQAAQRHPHRCGNRHLAECAFRKYPLYFDNLYCNLVEAGEAAGILEAAAGSLATYMEKTEAIKSKIKSALMYPISVVMVAFVVVTVIMIFVIPAFKEVFTRLAPIFPRPPCS
jgi:type IV pilus assembly protein PilC